MDLVQSLLPSASIYWEGPKPLRDPTSTIRILDLAPGCKTARLRCSLRTAPLASRPDYSAVSYTLGQYRAPTRDILLNDKLHQVPDELFRMLYNLRSEHEWRALWVDMLCIDQDNFEERTCQVQQMGSIYGQATQVLIWLGKVEDNSDLAFDAMNADEAPTTAHLGFTASMLSLCNRKYWMRVWIVPEIMHATDIVIHCGTKTVAWSRFANHCLTFAKVPAISQTRAVELIRLKVSGSILSTDLRSLLEQHGMMKCFDLRDRVYALLSLASDVRGDPTALQPDYVLDNVALAYKVYRFCQPQDPQQRGRFLAFLGHILCGNPHVVRDMVGRLC